MSHENNQTHVEYNMTMFEEMLSFAQNGVLQRDNLNLRLISTTLLLVATKEPGYFLKLNKLKEKYIKQIKNEDLQDIYVHLCSFCAYMINYKGEEVYNRNLFNLHKEMIKRKLVTKKSFLYPNFMNFVKIACRVGEHNYAEKLISDFKSSIIEEEKVNVLSFCYATIENSKGNYRDSLRLFSRVNFQNFLFKVQVKISVLALYYRLGMYQEALGAIDSFKHYVKREKNLVPGHRGSYMQYLNLMKELIKFREEVYKTRKELLLQKIKEGTSKMRANPFSVKTWLLEEIEVLKKTLKRKSLKKRG